MSHPPLSRAELARRTNLDELVPAPPPPEDQRIPTASAMQPVDPEPKRSTTDALESQFGEVHLAEGLGGRHTKRWVRVVAWFVLAGPSMVMVALGIHQFLSEIGSADSLLDVLLVSGLTGVYLVIGGFWPYLLWRTRRPSR
jgi:hypothetical protein